MGALHAGHCSLVQKSLERDDATIVSIFVNPSQFAPTEDFDVYPRTFDSDLEILDSLESRSEQAHDWKKVAAVFAPKVSEMYPNGIPLDVSKQVGAFVSVQGLGDKLEGATRPQFFRGVATVVTKLLNVCSPTSAYFGQKDIQQTVVVKRLVQDLLINTEIVVVPTVREQSGLALSSRNSYLANDVKNDSAVISQSLQKAEIAYYEQKTRDASEIRQIVLDKLLPYTNGDLAAYRLDYISVNHPQTLEQLNEVVPGVGAVLSIAIYVPNAGGSETRLIDNVVLK
ncbi:unnamed protein product [Kuraishia capsulata CBS 1993]|uniref:Pantoate--beta-alanine ligase n=1 Tax=Kuraishia capsulata CBS 1993 TaxID=1382522 RepID=W6MPF0_9ASCO|nr:uncharacterized protein KUCA_T00004180001 [Kuraishia capsulata CBS 1993]CDK28198.1 unnamed protein product [Kuraishia capsulata CBS 1993]